MLLELGSSTMALEVQGAQGNAAPAMLRAKASPLECNMGTSGRLTVHVWNFDSKTAEGGALEVALPEGIRFDTNQYLPGAATTFAEDGRSCVVRLTENMAPGGHKAFALATSPTSNPAAALHGARVQVIPEDT